MSGPLDELPPAQVPLDAAEVSSVHRGPMTLPAPRQVLEGERVLRVNWLPGSDRLRGLCFCGAEAEASDPVEMWEWLLAHPDHPAGGPVEPPASGPLPAPPAHYVTDPLVIRERVPVLV
ncbi:MAG: hypothetical protein JWP46_1899 [Modestobacter sp.]|nr:hypothetical protein [Modestobacter sp.]